MVWFDGEMWVFLSPSMVTVALELFGTAASI